MKEQGNMRRKDHFSCATNKPRRQQQKTTIDVYIYRTVLFFFSFNFSNQSRTCVDALAYAPNFITKAVDTYLLEHSDKDNASNSEDVTTITTRFPPEPNGYLHLGHSKAVCFNYAVSKQLHNGRFHMRMDDTNPTKEEKEYIESILEDVKWILSNDEDSTSSSSSPPWDGDVRKTSDYFDVIYKCALSLVESGDAYVESLSSDEMREYRGTLTKPGKDSPYRNRSIEENLDMFQKMKDGNYENGEHILRAKIDMSSPNINMRDPALYRIIKDTPHPETGNEWCIYPMYDFSHPISDAVEGITHSLCSLEFEDHRPLYEWTLDKLIGKGLIEDERKRRGNGNGIPTQIEFSRLNLKYTVLSKRKLIHLVKYGYVNGWSDPRMPTLSGVRRRGIPAQALRLFNERNGISKVDSNIDMGVLEDCTREVMDKICPRAFCILNPLKVVITNWDDDNSLEEFNVPRHPKEEDMGLRTISFGKELYIERDDFFDVEGPEGEANGRKVPKGFKRLVSGGLARLKFAYVIKCDEIIRDAITNEPTLLKCTYLQETKSGAPITSIIDEKKNKPPKPGIIHWVETTTSKLCQINLYDRLFQSEIPGSGISSSTSSTTASTGNTESTTSTTSVQSSDVIDVQEEEEKEVDNASSDTLFGDEDEDDSSTEEKEQPAFLKDLNPNSLQILTNCYVEPSVVSDVQELQTKQNRRYCDLRYQFERNGYFALDEETTSDKLIFNRVVTLRDTWTSSKDGETEEASNKRTRGRGSNNESNTSKAAKGGGGGGGQPLPDEQRVALRVCQILSVEKHPTVPDSLVVCQVKCEDSEDDQPRTVVGKFPINVIKEAIDTNTPVVAVTNLKPAKIAGVESTAMLLAAVKHEESSDDKNKEKISLLTVSDKDETKITIGSLIGFDSYDKPQPDEMLKSKGAQKVWERIKSSLKINSHGQAVYTKNNEKEALLRLCCSDSDDDDDKNDSSASAIITCDLSDCTIQ